MNLDRGKAWPVGAGHSHPPSAETSPLLTRQRLEPIPEEAPSRSSHKNLNRRTLLVPMGPGGRVFALQGQWAR